MRFFVLIVILLLVFKVQAQCEKVLLYGKVEDSTMYQGFYNLMVINQSTGKGVFGRPDGSFSVYVNNNDSISLSVKGYHTVSFRVRANDDCQFKFRSFIELKAQEMKEVVIHPLKSLNQIKEERESLVMRETREVTGIEMLGSPITALFQTFSKKEQNKRWIAEQEFKDDQRKVVKELLRLYVAYDIVKLSEDEFNEFISFLNINPDFLKTATEMELVLYIKGKYLHYNSIHQRTLLSLGNWRMSYIYSTKQDEKLNELFQLLEAKQILSIPKNEIKRFKRFLNLKALEVENLSDSDLVTKICEKFERYKEFYKIDLK